MIFCCCAPLLVRWIRNLQPGGLKFRHCLRKSALPKSNNDRRQVRSPHVRVLRAAADVGDALRPPVVPDEGRMSFLWVPAYVAIGSNLDDPLLQVRSALQRLQSLESSRLITASGLYRTVPLGPQDQPEFV